MPPRARQILSAVAILGAAPASAATHAELQALVSGPWHHVPEHVTSEQQKRDEARCRLIAGQTPVDSTTPAVVEIVKWSAQVNCMQALGYEPGQARPRSAAGRPKVRIEAVNAAGGGMGIATCSDFNKSKGKPDVEALFFSWAEGFLTGWNMALPEKSSLYVDMALMAKPSQMEFMRGWCETNPEKRYLQGVTALMPRLR